MPLRDVQQRTSYPDGVVTPQGWQLATAATTDPDTTVLPDIEGSSGRFAVYVKNEKFVIAFNDGGTITYVTILLDGSTTTWTQGTTAP